VASTVACGDAGEHPSALTVAHSVRSSSPQHRSLRVSGNMLQFEHASELDADTTSMPLRSSLTSILAALVSPTRSVLCALENAP
jgi:hypothetical protein